MQEVWATNAQHALPVWVQQTWIINWSQSAPLSILVPELQEAPQQETTMHQWLLQKLRYWGVWGVGWMSGRRVLLMMTHIKHNSFHLHHQISYEKITPIQAMTNHDKKKVMTLTASSLTLIQMQTWERIILCVMRILLKLCTGKWSTNTAILLRETTNANSNGASHCLKAKELQHELNIRGLVIVIVGKQEEHIIVAHHSNQE